MKPPRFRIEFWGVRGSYPTPDKTTLAYGGHTSCVEASVGGHHLIFDAGTGIIPLGKKLANGRGGPEHLNLFLSHTHHDHVFGFYFFEPLFRPGYHPFYPRRGRADSRCAISQPGIPFAHQSAQGLGPQHGGTGRRGGKKERRETADS